MKTDQRLTEFQNAVIAELDDMWNLYMCTAEHRKRAQEHVAANAGQFSSSRCYSVGEMADAALLLTDPKWRRGET